MSFETLNRSSPRAAAVGVTSNHNRHAVSYWLDTENQAAANELYSGPKSRMVPIHDSMGGYNGSAPVYTDNIEAAARRRGYPNIQIGHPGTRFSQ